jgi:hypothetical protein
LRNDAVSEVNNRLIVPSRAATSTARSASHNYELVTLTPPSVPRQPRGERYSKTSCRQFARTRPALSSQPAHQLSRTTACIASERPHLAASYDAFWTAWAGAPAGLPAREVTVSARGPFPPFFICSRDRHGRGDHTCGELSPRISISGLPLASVGGYGIVSVEFKYA